MKHDEHGFYLSDRFLALCLSQWSHAVSATSENKLVSLFFIYNKGNMQSGTYSHITDIPERVILKVVFGRYPVFHWFSVFHTLSPLPLAIPDSKKGR